MILDFKLSRLLILIVCFISGTAFSQSTDSLSFEKNESTAFWKISGNSLTEPVYLLGVYPFPDPNKKLIRTEALQALQNSPRVFAGVELNSFFDYLMSLVTQMTQFSDPYGQSYEWSPSTLYDFQMKELPTEKTLQSFLKNTPPDFALLKTRISAAAGGSSAPNAFISAFELSKYCEKLGKPLTGLNPAEDYMKFYAQLVSIMQKNARVMSESFRVKMANMDGALKESLRNEDIDKFSEIEKSVYGEDKSLDSLVHSFRSQMVEQLEGEIKKGARFGWVSIGELGGMYGIINLLKNKGYTLTPIMDKSTSKSKKIQKKLNALTFSPSWEKYSTKDKRIEIDFPGKHKSMNLKASQFHEINLNFNNSFISELQILDAFPFCESDGNEQLLKRIDSLLYSSTAGKILSVKEISQQGYKGFEISSELRNQGQLYQKILVTSNQVVIARFVCESRNIMDQIGKKFVNSLRIQPSSYDWQKYQHPNDMYSFEMPLLHKESSEESVYYFTGHDSQGDYYLLSHEIASDNQIQNDEEELKYIARKQIVMSNGKELSFDYSEKDNAVRFSYQNQEGTYHGAVSIYGCNYFKLLTNSQKDNAQKFISSFQLQAPNYTSTETYHNADEFFTFTSPVPYSDETAGADDLIGLMGSMFGDYNDEDQKLDKSFSIIDSLTGQEIKLRVSNVSRYNRRTFDYYKFSNHRTDVKQDTSLNDSLQIHEVWYSEKNSSKVNRQKRILSNNTLYFLSAQMDTLLEEKFINSVFDSFQPGDSVLSEFDHRSIEDKWLSDMGGSDSALLAEACDYRTRNSLPGVTTKELISLYKKYDSEIHPENFQPAIIQRIADSKGKEIEKLNFLSAEYKTQNDTSVLLKPILSEVFAMRTNKSTQKGLQLLIDKPVLDSYASYYNSVFSSMDDSLTLVKNMFPEIYKLNEYEEYQEMIVYFLKEMIDSNIVTPDFIRPKKDYYLKKIRHTVRKAQAEKEQNEEARFWNYSVLKQISLVSKLENDPEVRKLLLELQNSNILLLMDHAWEIMSEMENPPSKFEILPSSLLESEADSVRKYNSLLKNEKWSSYKDSLFASKEDWYHAYVRAETEVSEDSLRFIGKEYITSPSDSGTYYMYVGTMEMGNSGVIFGPVEDLESDNPYNCQVYLTSTLKAEDEQHENQIVKLLSRFMYSYRENDVFPLDDY